MADDTVTLNPGSGGAKVQTFVNTVNGVASVETQAVALVSPAGSAIGTEPFGSLSVSDGYQTLFYDSWSVSPIDTTDKWTVTGTTPTIANGVMTMVATASSYNAIQTKDTIRSNVGYTLVRNGISIETTTTTGAGRFWGLGVTATTPAANVLAQNGIGFELDQATGALLAVTYSAGVRTTVASLTRPTDGLNHAYGLYFRVTQAYWVVDGTTVASQAFPNVTVAEIPALIVRQNAAAFTGTPLFVNIAHLTADTSRQGLVMSDPIVGTRQARVEATGALKVSTESGKATYTTANTGTTPAATPTDFFSFVGSATKLVRVRRVMVAGYATATGSVLLFMVKRTTADTGGTRTVVTSVASMDSLDPASTATLGIYSVNPTAVGTAAGYLYSARMNLVVAGSPPDRVILDFTTRNNKGLVLRGVNESLCMWFNAQAMPSGTNFDSFIEWTEE